MPRRDPAYALPATARRGMSAELSAVGRLVAMIGVGAFGAAALTVAAPSAPVQPAAVSAPGTTATGVHRLTASDRITVVRRHARPVARPAAHPSTAHPHARAARPRSAHRSAPTHWLPTGTGMWIYQWQSTNGGDAGSIVARARRVGLTTLYLRTGSSHDGFTGARRLRALLPATRGTALHVVAWDFPALWHPVHDALRLARAARFGRSHRGPHVAAVAPDIETPAEGTFNAAWRVRAYFRTLRQHLPHGVTILTAVPWPSRYRIADYPYATVAGHSDALVPMAYWYNNSPSLVTGRSISYLRGRFHKPVMPVGQGYDGKLDVPSLHHNNLSREVPSFFRVAHAHGARAVSLWSWQAAPPSAWQALSHARHLFHSHR